jgi:SAM-dependent methyltransferase
MNELIEEIVRQHLQGNYSDSLTRFSYLNGGAEQFIRLTQNPDYTSYMRELGLIESIFGSLEHFSCLQVIDFGVGDGRKLNLVLSNLRKYMEVSYLGLDLSSAMIDIARKNNSFGNTYSTCDFSDMFQLIREFSKLPDTQRLIFMLGNTITNEIDIENYLRSLRRIVNRLTYLMIGLELFQDNADEIVREYQTEENYDLTFRPLERIGIERAHGIVDIDFNLERQRIEEWFIFNKTGQVRNIHYQKGDRVLLSVTHKLTMAQIREIVSNSGWCEEKSVENNGYALLLLSSNT